MRGAPAELSRVVPAGASLGVLLGSAGLPAADAAEGRRTASFSVVAWGGAGAAASGGAGA